MTHSFLLFSCSLLLKQLCNSSFVFIHEKKRGCWNFFTTVAHYVWFSASFKEVIIYTPQFSLSACGTKLAIVSEVKHLEVDNTRKLKGVMYTKGKMDDHWVLCSKCEIAN